MKSFAFYTVLAAGVALGFVLFSPKRTRAADLDEKIKRLQEQFKSLDAIRP